MRTSAKELGKPNSEKMENEIANSVKEDDAPKECIATMQVSWKETFGEILLKNLEDNAKKILDPHESLEKSLEESCKIFEPIKFENASHRSDPKPDSEETPINQTPTMVSSQGENKMRRSKKKAYRDCLSNERPGADPQILLAQTETGEFQLVDVVDFKPSSSNVSSSETLREVKVGSTRKEKKEEFQNPKEDPDNELISHILRLRERYEQGIDREKIARVILEPHAEPFISQELADRIFMKLFYFAVFVFLFFCVCPFFEGPPLIEILLKSVMRFILDNCKLDI